MIVCSLPRCGATRFCLDLQEKIGLPFVGEMHPIHIENDRKSLVHETQYQTAFTPKQFADLIHCNKDCIVLINQHSYLKVRQAEFIILRRNMKNAYLSMANFMIKMYPNIKLTSLIHQLSLMRNDQLAIEIYLDKYPREVIWYEDYYDKKETDTPLLDAYAGRDIIIKALESYHGASNR